MKLNLYRGMQIYIIAIQGVKTLIVILTKFLSIILMKSQPKNVMEKPYHGGETVMYVVSFPLRGKCYYITGTLLWGETDQQHRYKTEH